jgi:hypothetical protein
MEEQLGTCLPADFRDFIFRYGTGVFNEPGRLCISPSNPLAPDFHRKFRSDCDWLREMKDGVGDEEFPYAVFPQNPGLFLWAEDDNGCLLFWLTEGEADRWPVLLRPPGPHEFERIDLPMTSFLARAFARTITCSIWASPEFFFGPRKVKFAQTQSEIEYQ